MVQASRRKFHYIYKTTCCVTNKFYIGMHSTDSLEDGYVGSGKLLWYSIHKHGKENHSTEILEFLPSRDSLKLREAQIVNEELLGEKLCMNLRLGGTGGFEHLTDEQRSKGVYKGIETRNRKFKSDENYANDFKEKMRDIAKKSVVSGERHSFLNSKKFAGKKHSPEAKKLISEFAKLSIGNNNSQFDTCWIYSIIEKQSKKINKTDLDFWISNGWTKGRKIKF